MAADKQFLALVFLILLSGVSSFYYLGTSQPGSLRASKFGVPFLSHSVQHPESGECISANELARHFLN